MNEVEQALEDYVNARTKLGELFDPAPMWYNIIDETDSVWTDYGGDSGSISWGAEDVGPDGELEYSAEVYGTSRWEKDGYAIFVAGDGCGNRDLYMFKNRNKTEEY